MPCEVNQVKHLFCNTLITTKKSIIYDKPEYKMSKVEFTKWISRNKYR